MRASCTQSAAWGEKAAQGADTSDLRRACEAPTGTGTIRDATLPRTP
jgi:hypothetical protein